MSAIQAAAAYPLRIYLCGAIKPNGGTNQFLKASVRHFVASGLVLFEGHFAHLSQRENQIFAAIISDPTPNQMRSIELAMTIDDPSGGPEWLVGSIHIVIMRLKEKLSAIGLDLVRRGHSRAPYMLTRRAE